MLNPKYLNFKERLKDSGFVSTHDGFWKNAFEKNGFKWHSWWDEFCGGWYCIIGLNKAGSWYSSTFGEKGENYLLRWIYSGNVKYLKPFYEWFGKTMDKRLKESLSKKTENEKVAKTSTKVGFVYLIKNNGFTKIGRAKRPQERYKKYITENPTKVKLIFQKRVNDYLTVERELHKIFESRKVRSEWFDLSKEDIESAKKFLSSWQ